MLYLHIFYELSPQTINLKFSATHFLFFNIKLKIFNMPFLEGGHEKVTFYNNFSAKTYNFMTFCII